ncbi:tyrosine-type recombinase/integrase [Alienimonas chondri]|uniref:Tyr recombinase domain-containing protein n=1 Tax=Alienimonas chondri TaxID=2681879 RepID=A0ABX1VAI4_9PLAN|nr:tyrosine-type recombinase/integrase [Alienimonas chondri]NNJ24031.1 hypothetical protein [Alienimonas chondri]
MRLPKLSKNPDGRAFVRIPKTNGKRAYFGRYGTAEAEAKYREWVGAYVADPESTTRPAVEGWGSIAKLCHKFMVHADEYYRDEHRSGGHTSSYGTHKKVAETFAMLNGTKPADRIDASMVRAFQRYLVVTPGKGGKPAARVYVNALVDDLRYQIKWWESHGLVPKGTHHHVMTVENLKEGRTSARETAAVQPVDQDVVVATMAYMPPTLAEMVCVQFACGMRPQDVCRLSWGHIDRSGDDWRYSPVRHKNAWRKKKLVKAIPEAVRPLLLKRADRPADEAIFRPVDAAAEQRGGRRSRKVQYNTDFYRQSIHRAVRQARDDGKDVPTWSPNQLRHAIATAAGEQFDLEGASALLGHSGTAATAIYAKTTDRKLAKYARQLDEYVLAGSGIVHAATGSTPNNAM